MTHKAFKFKLKPTKEQEQQLVQWTGCSRWIWNWCLSTNKEEYEKTKKFIFKFDLKKQIPLLKKEFPWLSEAPSQALQNRVLDFDAALKRVWKQGNGFPKFKSRHIEHHNTLRMEQVGSHIKPTKKQIKVPKLGWVKWTRHRPLEGKLKNITIKKENNHWWCICLCEVPDVETRSDFHESEVVGIDLGISSFVVMSDGNNIKSTNEYRKAEKKLKRQQRKLSRKKKGSNNRNKQRIKVNKIHAKIKNKRQDFTHKLSNQIAKDYPVIAVEDLTINGMKKNRHLSKSISDQGWAVFLNQLLYKAKRNGGTAIKIDKFAPSSKTCSCCGNIKESLMLSERIYKCENCGLELDRDLNAAINIKAIGIDKLNRTGTVRIYACGDTNDGEKAIDFSSYVSMKQEKFFTDGKEADTF